MQDGAFRKDLSARDRAKETDQKEDRACRHEDHDVGERQEESLLPAGEGRELRMEACAHLAQQIDEGGEQDREERQRTEKEKGQNARQTNGELEGFA